jgi:hypothetical protein
MTAFSIAEDVGYQNIMMMVSQHNGGFYGPVKATRGFVIERVLCPFGCGTELIEKDVYEHCQVSISYAVWCHNY